jgi:hypothetical protein
MFVDNDVTSSHQARTVALNYSLEAQEQKTKRNKAKSKKTMNGLGNNCIYDKVQLALYKGTRS